MIRPRAHRLDLSAARRPRRPATSRGMALALLLGLFGLLWVPTAQAAPVTSLTGLPANLAKYVPNSPAWNNSPWMTSPTCRNKGGDVGIWVNNVADDTPALLAFFQASAFGPHAPAADKPLYDEIIAGYQTLAQQVPSMLPTGSFCVDQMTQWAGADPSQKPFGFPIGIDPTHQSQYFCTDLADPNQPPSAEYNKFVGAERAPCDGFYISCTVAPAAQKTQCAAWDSFSDEYVKRVDELRGQAINDHPNTGQGATKTVVKSPSQVASGLADSWFVNLVKSITQGATTMLADSMSWWTTADHTTLLQSPAIAQIQSELRYVGLALLAGSLIWQGLMMIYRRKLDPLVSTGMGLLSYVGWTTLAGTIAVLINQAGIALADQVLNQSIDGFTNSVSGTMIGLVGAQTGAIFFLAIALFLLSAVQWVLGFFRMGALVILLALIPTAAAGQLNEGTKPWLPKILGWSLTLLLYQPIAAIVDAIGFTLVGKGGSLSTVLVGLAVLALAVLSMPTMLRFFDWGGQRLTAGGGGGGVAAAAGAASLLGSGGPGAFGRFMDQHGTAGGRSGQDTGALPVSSAHRGDGPGSGSTSTGGGRSATNTSSPGTGSGEANGGSGVSQAAAGAEQGAMAGAGAAGGAAKSATAGTSGAGATVGGAAAGAGGGAAAAAGPAGAAVAGAQIAAQGVNHAADAAAGAMTEGSGDSGGAA